jgi:amino acid permease
MSEFTANAVLVISAIMGVLIFLAVYIGLHFSKKSAQKLQEKRKNKEN